MFKARECHINRLTFIATVLYVMLGHTMAQAVSGCPLVMEAWVCTQVSPCRGGRAWPKPRLKQNQSKHGTKWM
jgi:hypothetical protein